MKTAVELRAAFAAREVSPVEVVEAAQEHAELGAFVTLTLESAREEAKNAERAYRDGTDRPLEGLPLAVKDLFDTEGVRTTLRLAHLRRPRPAGRRGRGQARQARGRDRRRQDADARVRLGHHERQPALPAVPQPVGPGARSPAARSAAPPSRSPPVKRRSRSAATPAARSASPPPSAASPASSRRTTGSPPPASSRSPARSTTSARWRARPPTSACFYEALIGRAHVEQTEPRIAVCSDLHCARSSRASSAPSTSPSLHSRSRSSSPFDEAERIYPAFAAIQNVEAALAHADLFPARRDEYSADVAKRLERARTVTIEDYVEATATRERIRAGFARLFASADLLLTPIPASRPSRRGVAHRTSATACCPSPSRRTSPACRPAPCPSASTTSACRSACSSPARRGARAACSPPPRRCSARQHRRGRNPRRPGDLRDPHPDLVLEAPAPVLAGLERADDRVARRARVSGGVLVRRVVAAADVTAAEADPQVQPDAAGRRGSPRSRRPPRAAR